MRVRIGRRLDVEQEERLLSIWGLKHERPWRGQAFYRLRRRLAIRWALKKFLDHHLQYDLPRTTLIWSDD